jgi:hypothetical protein
MTRPGTNTEKEVENECIGPNQQSNTYTPMHGNNLEPLMLLQYPPTVSATCGTRKIDAKN